jgi:hypothetical protein
MERLLKRFALIVLAKASNRLHTIWLAYPVRRLPKHSTTMIARVHEASPGDVSIVR